MRRAIALPGLPLAWVLLLLLAAGCEDKKPPATNGGIPPGGNTGGGDDDSGVSDAGDDGSVADGGLPFGCKSVPDDDITNSAAVTGGTAAARAFDVNYAFARWSNDCAHPTLIVGLGETSCDPGFDQQLLFLIDQDAIGTIVAVGPNPLPTNVSGLFNAQYAASSGAGVADRWQNCNEAPGFVDFTSIDDAKGTNIVGTFDITLTACSDLAGPAPVTLSGSFSVTLEQSFAEACPSP